MYYPELPEQESKEESGDGNAVRGSGAKCSGGVINRHAIRLQSNSHPDYIIINYCKINGEKFLN